MEQKDITKEEVRKVVERYYREHPNLPPEEISDKEWNALYDVIEAHFLANNIMDEYNSALNIIIRRALYYALTKDTNKFTINHLLAATTDLTVFHISSKEIKAIQEEINDKTIAKNYSK